MAKRWRRERAHGKRWRMTRQFYAHLHPMGPWVLWPWVKLQGVEEAQPRREWVIQFLFFHMRIVVVGVEVEKPKEG